MMAMTRPIIWVTGLMLGMALLPLSWAASVCSVHDGDTFRLCYGPSIRLWGVDAPELSQPYGEQSKQALEKLLSQKNVNLTCANTSYKRWVCLVEVDNKNVNYEMVRQGMAYAEPHYSSNTFKEVETTAKDSMLGIWSQPDGGEKPWEYRHRVKQADTDKEEDPTMGYNKPSSLDR